MRPFLPVLFALAALPLAAAPAEPDPANPFFRPWKTPFGAPPFAEIKEDHYLPAYREAMARQKREIAALVNRAEAPTFANTIEALEDSGELLDVVGSVFGNLTTAETSPRLQAIQQELAPMLAKHGDDISLDEGLFKRVKAVWDRRDALKLDPVQARLLDETYRGFVRAGALLTPAQKTRMRAINEELSVLGVKFTDNLLKETNAYQLVIEKPEDLAGLPADVVSAAATTAKAAGKEGRWVFTLHAPSIWPFLQNAQNRELRRQIMRAYLDRCSRGNAQDNGKIIARVMSLRVEKAHLLGYRTWSHYVLEDRMAKTPEGAMGLMDKVWGPTLAMAKREAAELQKLLDQEKPGSTLEAWDWRYYSEKLKKAKYQFDEEELRPYFQLENVRKGAFHVAGKLFGLTFTERKDVPVYHPEVKAFEVKEKDGRHVGLLLVDDHPRPGKTGGAWMSNYRNQWIRNGEFITPIVVNVGNYARPTNGKPALLSPDEVETIFHEFGHGLHGLLTRCRYRSLSGSNVARDFVELPSQIMEHWAMEPEVLKVMALHYETGRPIPAELVAKLERASRFNMGFSTGEYIAACKLDLDWHSLSDPKEVDPAAFEKASLDRMGLIPQIPPRYRTPYFNHLFGWGYASAYYSYAWSEVLDSDAFEAFKEKGDLFDPATAAAFREHVLSRGNTEDPAVLYRRFRGRDPKVEPYLKRRGLM